MKKIDLGKYDLKQILRNPALIHTIQDALGGLQGDDLLSMAIRRGATDDLAECLKMIVGGYEDNPSMLTEIVGIETLRQIEEYLGKPFLINLENTIL